MSTKNIFGMTWLIAQSESNLPARDILILTSLKLITEEGDLEDIKQVLTMLSGYITWPPERNNPFTKVTGSDKWKAAILKYYRARHSDMLALYESHKTQKDT